MGIEDRSDVLQRVAGDCRDLSLGAFRDGKARHCRPAQIVESDVPPLEFDFSAFLIVDQRVVGFLRENCSH